MSEKVQKGKKDVISTPWLIKLIVCEALENMNVKISWEHFWIWIDGILLRVLVVYLGVKP
jgi:hypothetical protein